MTLNTGSLELQSGTSHVANMDGFNAGMNGLGGTDWHPSVIYMYQGCFAIKDSANNTNDWIGPYSGGI